ncbi:Protein kinase, AMP-activated, beta [Chamberlinius hualienensis]
MGNSGSGSRERHKSGDIGIPSPRDNQAFDFTKKKILYQGSLEASGDESIPKELDSASPRSATPPALAAALAGTGIDENVGLPTVFKWDGGGKQVYISGTFTNWKSMPMAKSHGDFVTIVDVPEGDHQFKFQVDGSWRYDPTEPTVDNGMGSKNNVISVKKQDFEVFQALEYDSSSSPSSQQNISGSPPGDYMQEIPERKSNEKQPAPPFLPPQLLQVILNKDIPVSCEPTLLPEPQHVMLNHLYALSIKDGVMVLSATHRYRKKYVTTLLYKPI